MNCKCLCVCKFYLSVRECSVVTTFIVSMSTLYHIIV